jgi:DNA mismatch repair protein MSH2
VPLLVLSVNRKIASEIHAFCLFATHFHELTALDQELSHVKNLHVVAHVGESDGQSKDRDITLLYKVEPGKFYKKSNCRRAHTDKDVRRFRPKLRHTRRQDGKLSRTCRSSTACPPCDMIAYSSLKSSQLAKRKAAELEDFGTGNSLTATSNFAAGLTLSIPPEQQESQFSPEVIESGVQVVEELLKTWASRSPLETSAVDGEDIVMTDDLSPEAQLDELKSCFSEYQTRIESNPWIQSILASL